MEVVYPEPELHTLFDFVVNTCMLAGVELTSSEVTATYNREMMHPGAHGIFAGIQTVKELVHKPKWPINHPIEFQDIANSDKNLYWIRTLHLRVMKPIATYGETTPNINEIISLNECGNYRLKRTFIGLDRPMPEPHAVKPLLHWWHKDLGHFHLKWLPKLNKVGALSLSDVEQLANEAYKKHIQFVCIHPFKDGNGRVGRFIENALRNRWGLTWKTIKFQKRMDHVNDIMKYEDSTEWKQILSTTLAQPSRS